MHPPPTGGVWADTNYVVPTGGGTINSFSFQSDGSNAGHKFDYLVLQPVSGTTYKVVGKTGLQTLAGTVGVVNFPVSIPVHGGAR